MILPPPSPTRTDPRFPYTTLFRSGLADPIGPASWTLKPGSEETLRALSIRGDIIKIMPAAMSRGVNTPDIASFATHDDQIADPVLGRLVERGLHDELAGTAYARSEERRVGKECVSTFRSRWSPVP